MAGDTIQSKNLEEYITEARESTTEEFMKSHDESYFLVGSIPVVGSDDSKKLVYATVAGGDVRGFNKRSQEHFVYEITFDRISAGQPVWFGRTSNCTIHIEHPIVSKLQGYLKLDIKEKKMVYADIGSKNGSKIGRVQLTPSIECHIKSGQVLIFGETIRFDFYSLSDFRDMLERLK